MNSATKHGHEQGTKIQQDKNVETWQNIRSKTRGYEGTLPKYAHFYVRRIYIKCACKLVIIKLKKSNYIKETILKKRIRIQFYGQVPLIKYLKPPYFQGI